MTKSLSNRNPGLDVLRSICLFLVVLQHSFMFTDAFFPKFRILWFVSHSALDIFFILSGFLVGGIIEKKYSEKNQILIKDIFKFYKRRWYKTLPMYFLTVSVFLLLSYLNIYSPKDFSWRFIFFLQNITQANFHFLPHTYSLTIEEWFYLFFPLLLFGISKLNLKANPFYILFLIWIIFAIVMRIVKHEFSVENWDSEIRKAIITRIDSVIYGVILYFIHLKNTNFIKKFRVLLLLAGVTGYVVSTFILKNNLSLFYNNVVYYTILPLFICGILPLFIYLRLPIFLEKHFTIQSLASYTIYLIHLPLFYIINEYNIISSALKSLFLMLISIITVYLIGIFLYQKVEKPIMDLRDY